MISKYLSPKNDFAFKKIFGSETHKDILIHFLNDILCFQGNERVLSVDFLPTNMNPDVRSKKQSIVDVLCEDHKGTRFIVEMQVAKMPGFEKRAQFYAAKTYSDQLRIGEKYVALKEIIFLAILDFVVFPEKSEYKSDHIILDKVTYEHDLKDFSFTFIELPKFKKKKGEKLDSIIEKWCYFFKYADETSNDAEVDRVIGENNIIRDAYKALDYFNWSESDRLSYEAMVKIERDNAAVAEYAIQEAQEKGIEKGELQASVKIAENLLKKGFSMEEVAEMTSLTLDEIKKINGINKINKDQA